VLGWGAFVYGASALSGGRQAVAEADDAGRRLVTLEGDGRPAYAVVLRSGGGPFEQESLVYQGVAGAPAPTARFVDPGTVEVAVGTCRYRSGVEPSPSPCRRCTDRSCSAASVPSPISPPVSAAQPPAGRVAGTAEYARYEARTGALPADA
jgi:hypothetical protein